MKIDEIIDNQLIYLIDDKFSIKTNYYTRLGIDNIQRINIKRINNDKFNWNNIKYDIIPIIEFYKSKISHIEVSNRKGYVGYTTKQILTHKYINISQFDIFEVNLVFY